MRDKYNYHKKNWLEQVLFKGAIIVAIIIVILVAIAYLS